MSDSLRPWKSKITEDARRRMVRSSAKDQRRQALELSERERSRPEPIPDSDDDADDASLRRGMLT